MEARRFFASDNGATVHPRIMEALSRVNVGHAVGYGDDPHTRTAIERFRSVFGPDTEVFFVYNGTGANTLGLGSLTRSHNAVLCTENAHIHVDECGAPEKFTGCKLITIPTVDGKLRVEDLEPHLHVLGVEHHVQPKVVSVTQVTEVGTTYRLEELRRLAEFAHEHGMYLHMDGARIANAAAFLDTDLKSVTRDCGVDVLSFGGTKNGLMFGEAVVFFDPEPAAEFRFVRKQGTQLASKMRYISAQFDALFQDDLWLTNARHANAMAALLARRIEGIREVELVYPVESNAVFATFPKDKIQALQQRSFFYVWDEGRGHVRWVASFDTTESDVERLVQEIRSVL
jgi:threonine aldolase